MRIGIIMLLLSLVLTLGACGGETPDAAATPVTTTVATDIATEHGDDTVGMTEMVEDVRKWNAMWDCWAEGEALSPYAELMTYQSEVNNGGHWQYFVNTDDLNAEMAVLDDVLSATLKENLHTAYEAYLSEDEAALAQCDDVYFDNEEDVNVKLEEYVFGNDW